MKMQLPNFFLIEILVYPVTDDEGLSHDTQASQTLDAITVLRNIMLLAIAL